MKTLLTVFAILIVIGNMQTTNAQERGIASYYSPRLNGRKLASGGRYHKDSLICAHKTLPFGTLVHVKNIENGKEVIVRVEDRGPFRKGRVIDLSYAAAVALDMVKKGLCKVELRIHHDSGKISIPNQPPHDTIPAFSIDTLQLTSPVW